MLERLIDLLDVDGAHGTQVLGHHQIGVDGAERPFVQGVEILTRGQTGPDHGVDLPRRQSLGHRGVRHDPPRPGFGREVALEGHPDHVGPGPDGEEDLGG
jgi:hypothetical protein